MPRRPTRSTVQRTTGILKALALFSTAIPTRRVPPMPQLRALPQALLPLCSKVVQFRPQRLVPQLRQAEPRLSDSPAPRPRDRQTIFKESPIELHSNLEIS